MVEVPEIETWQVTQVWVAARADGRKAIVFGRAGARPVALEMTMEQAQVIVANLSELIRQASSEGTA